VAATRIPGKQATLSPGAQAWQRMWEVYKASRPYMESLTAEFDLTPMQAYALKLLSGGSPLVMSALADSLGCDASYVTSIVDRLESRGLVERRSAENDRRAKALIVTPAGAVLHHKLATRMEQPPPAIANLSREDQRELRDILQRALDSISER
jgi:DNA-binding MarR family transcriptional regulator